MEGNLANEVGLVVLDTIELFCGHFKVSALLCYFGVEDECDGRNVLRSFFYHI